MRGARPCGGVRVPCCVRGAAPGGHAGWSAGGELPGVGERLVGQPTPVLRAVERRREPLAHDPPAGGELPAGAPAHQLLHPRRRQLDHEVALVEHGEVLVPEAQPVAGHHLPGCHAGPGGQLAHESVVGLLRCHRWGGYGPSARLGAMGTAVASPARRALALAVVLLGTVPVGCGDDGNDAGEEPPDATAGTTAPTEAAAGGAAETREAQAFPWRPDLAPPVIDVAVHEAGTAPGFLF